MVCGMVWGRNQATFEVCENQEFDRFPLKRRSPISEVRPYHLDGVQGRVHRQGEAVPVNMSANVLAAGSHGEAQTLDGTTVQIVPIALTRANWPTQWPNLALAGTLAA